MPPKNRRTYATAKAATCSGRVFQQQGGAALTGRQTLGLKGGLSTNNRLVSLDSITFNSAQGTLEARTRANNPTSVLPGVSDELGAIIGKVAGETGLDVNHSNAGIRFISRATDTRYISDASESARTLEGAARISAAAGVQGMAVSVANAATSAATTRTGFADTLQSNAQVMEVRQSDGGGWEDSGLSSGDGTARNGLGLWIMPLYQSENVWGMKADNFKTGYNGGFGGVALGADYTIQDAFRFGVVFNIGGGYAQSNGDFHTTENNFDFWGVNLCGGWTRNNFAVTADIGYTGAYNKVKQDMPSGMQMKDLKADVTISTISAGVNLEYKFETSIVDITPHAGVRYMALITDSFDTKRGGTVFSTDRSDQNIWTFPVGVALSKSYEFESGWKFTPKLDATIIPAAGDVKVRNNVRVPDVDISSALQTRVVDDVTFGGGVGFEARKDNISFGASYTVQASEHLTGQGVFGTFRVEF